MGGRLFALFIAAIVITASSQTTISISLKGKVTCKANGKAVAGAVLKLKKFNISVQVLCPPDTDTPGFATENLTKPAETRAISASTKIISSEKVAEELIAGIKKNTFMIIPGFDGKLIYFVKRLFPFVINMVMDSAISKTQKG